VTALSDQLEALGRFVSVTRPYLPPDVLDPASTVVDRAGDRLALSLDHTVVALAGATGSGKSSIFNGLAGVTLSPAGVRRPTTGSAYACVWGPSATPLLDWLKVDQRFTVADPALDGLVLVDLPDFDSVQASHRLEVDRLLQVVDLIVWVMHPQKYADKVVHSRYLQQFAGHADVTIVVLNAVDLLAPPDLAECVADLSELLEADGLGGVPVLTSSTVGPPGLSALSAALAKSVAAKKAVLQRLSADVSGAVSTLSPLVAAPPSRHAVEDGLSESLARAAGVPVVASAVEGAYVHRARKATGWPPARWVRRFRPDPLRRLRLATPGATSIAPASSASVAAVGLAVRDAARTDLPEPWPDAMLKAARSHMDDVPDALDVAVAQTPLNVPERRWWWTLFGVLQWIGTIALAAGVLWLLVRYVLFALALPEPPMPDVGRLPLPTALLLGGLLFGWLLAILARLVVRAAARQTRRRAVVRLRKAVDRVAQDMILAPIEAVRTAYREAQAALKRAAG
jgi:hypothetical protein